MATVYQALAGTGVGRVLWVLLTPKVRTPRPVVPREKAIIRGVGLPNARVNPTMPLGGRLRCLELLGRATGVRNEIIFAYVHGSFLSGPYRDIDVAVYLSADMRRVDRFDYEAQLAAALGESVGQPVDVQVLNSAPLGVQHAVLNGQAIFVRDDEVRCAFFEDVARRHMDFDYLSRQFMTDVLER